MLGDVFYKCWLDQDQLLLKCSYQFMVPVASAPGMLIVAVIFHIHLVSLNFSVTVCPLTSIF